MRVFFDTNILLEYLCGRSKALVIRKLLDCIEYNGEEDYAKRTILFFMLFQHR